MLVLAIIILLRPLLRPTRSEPINQDSLNLDIYKQHLRELDADLANAQVSQEEYNTSKQDLEKQLIMDIPQKAAESMKDNKPGRLGLTSVILAIPAAAIAMYVYLGSPDALNTAPVKQANTADAHSKVKKPEKSLPSVSEMIAKLEQKVKQEPENIEGWNLLSRSYMHTRQFKKAELALAQLSQLKTDDPTIWANYADIVAVNQKGSLEGKPFEYTKRALALQPKHPKALWLAGTYHFQQNNYNTAIRFWEILRSQLPPASKDTTMITNSINDARQRMGKKPEEVAITAAPAQPAISPASIEGTVSISQDLMSKTSPTDTVFVYARAANGPRMPLAVVKKQVSDLPFEFKLDDSMAMMPQMKLSAFDQVMVTARVSKSGNAITQSGDLVSRPISINSRSNKAVALEINSVSP